MITRTMVCRGPEGAYDPFRNLAVEKNLTFLVQEGQCILYLWQNRRTVVIGRNQNAWKECNVDALAADGGTLARRLSGGGAVYHDLGNLNFSFCVRREDYDVDRQLEVIRHALRREGIEACKSGRNDLLAEGRKFSGNAFYKSGEFCCHHGTIMIDVNREQIGRYLHVPQRKLISKGIASVQSRVVNLKELCPDLTVDRLCASLREAFTEVYECEAQEYRVQESRVQEENAIAGVARIMTSAAAAQKRLRTANQERAVSLTGSANPAEVVSLAGSASPADIGSGSFLNMDAIRKDTAFFASHGWIFGTGSPFTHQMEGSFEWGGIRILFQVENGAVTDCRIESDAMDQEAVLQIAAAFKGSMYEKQMLLRRIDSLFRGQSGQDDPENMERRKMTSDIRGILETELN